MITIKNMLIMGKECGLTHVEEAYNNVMNHYDAFFIIDSYEMRDFNDALRDSPLVKDNTFEDLTIDEALALLST